MMLQMLLIFLAFFYLVIAFCVYTQWLEIMQRDVCIKSHILLYKLFLMIATILWPIVVPLAYLELILKLKSKRESIGAITDTEWHSVVETDALTYEAENSVLLLSGRKSNCI